MPEITPADCKAVDKWRSLHPALTMFSYEVESLRQFARDIREAAVAEERERIKASLTAHVMTLMESGAMYAAVGLQDFASKFDELLATPTPAPQPLTPEAIKRILPANGHDGLNYTANYSKLLRWCHKRNGEFELSIDEKPLPLESLTDQSFAQLVAALGIEVKS